MRNSRFLMEVATWIERHKFKSIHQVTVRLNLTDDEGRVEHALYFIAELMQNGFNERKVRIIKSNYRDECPYFTPSEKNHSYWKEYLLPWSRGKEIPGLPVKQDLRR